MVTPGTIYIESRDRRGLLHCGVWCEACVKEYRERMAGLRGLSIQTWPWAGEAIPCDRCDDSENAPDFKFSTVVALVVMLLFGGAASAQTTPIIVGNVADIVSTEIGLRVADAREVNPVLGQTTAQRVAVKAAGAAVQVWVAKRIGKRHPTAAKVFGYAVGAALSGVAIHNARVAWRVR